MYVYVYIFSSWFTNRQKNDVQGWDLIEWSNGQTTALGNLYKSKPNNGESWDTIIVNDNEGEYSKGPFGSDAHKHGVRHDI